MRAKIGATSELALALNGDSAHTPPSHILENLSAELALRRVAGAPHTIYAEVWHAAFWQQITLEWLRGVETLCPERAALGFPTEKDERGEPWADLCRRFLSGAEKAAAIANGEESPRSVVVCPSPAGNPPRDA